MNVRNRGVQIVARGPGGIKAWTLSPTVIKFLGNVGTEGEDDQCT